MELSFLASVVGILVLLVLSAFFSGSETALTAASRPRMHQLERNGDLRARRVNRLFEHRERLLGAILFGNNLVNILASALATSILILAFGDAGVVYATAVMTFLVLIFGEVMPKSIAFRHADRFALGVAPVMRVIVALFAPITRAIQIIINGLFRLFGAQLATEDEMAAATEALRGAIELHRGEKPEVRHERNMLRSIMELSDVDVDEVMQHRQDIFMIDADLPPGEIVDRVLESPYTRIPLYRGEVDNIVGVLHAKELLRSVHGLPERLDELNIDDISSRPWFIPESTSLLDQLQAFRTRREHFALVVDEYGSLMGVVTLEDILEEIVGEITDEHDIVPAGIRPLSDGSYMIDGRVTLRDLNRRFEWDLPDEEAATLAGLVIHEAKLIPEVDQIFNFYGFRFEIVRRRRNRITSIRVTPPPPQSGHRNSG